MTPAERTPALLGGEPVFREPVYITRARAPDRAALFLRLADPFERTQEPLSGIDDRNRQPQAGAETVLHVPALVLAQQPGIDENRRETLAHGSA